MFGKKQTLIICSSKHKLFAEIHENNEKNTNMNRLYLPYGNESYKFQIYLGNC